jgi:hypothetical protein
MRAHFEREAAQESPWTSYNASLGRPLLNTEKFLAPKKAPVAETATPDLEAELESASANSSPNLTPTLPGLEPRR